ncbi:hypothetical protein Malapachy_0081 [Malassezia pachydermatis]|uniref:Nitrogen permease regulator 3 n=1 Tax=Malassezia pachydermatis TaxID=77020 RepID=A0A0M8MIX6_9BASI|nr:hypothetical protein Malapachy_0081 [Malassezia pachydermatis]KOS13376.1 hypothetical protein Malapachy_0081 [Malassezia pachydermatis]
MKSPLLAILLVRSSSRGTNIVFQWPTRIKRHKKKSHMRYYTNDDSEDVFEDPMATHNDSESDTDDSNSDAYSSSSEGSFNEDAVRLRVDDDDRLDRDLGPSRLQRDVGSSQSLRGSRFGARGTSPDMRSSAIRSRSASRPPRMSASSYASFEREYEEKRLRSFTTCLDFDSEMLASILTPRIEQCHQRFELSVDDITYLGHPVSYTEKSEDPKSKHATIFNVVFVFDRSNMYPSIPVINPVTWFNLFYSILFKLTAVLAAEEFRSGYMSEQCLGLIRLREEFAQNGCWYRDFLHSALDSFTLAGTLKEAYRGISRHRNVEIEINNSFDLNLQLPLILRHPEKAMWADEVQCVLDPHDPIVIRGDGQEPRDMASMTSISSQNGGYLEPVLKEWTRTTGPFLRPWQTLLLPEEAYSSDTDATIYASTRALIDLFRPTVRGSRTFLQAAEILGWDLYKDVYPMVRHLIYYSNAPVINVPRIQNIYAINPTFNTNDLAALSEAWAVRFSQYQPLPQFLARVSSDLKPFVSHCEHLPSNYFPLDLLLWLLRQGVLIQMHVHLRVVITASDQRRAVELRRERRERMLRRRQEPGVDSGHESDPEILTENLIKQMDKGISVPERPVIERRHSRHSRCSRSASSSSISSSDEEWPSGHLSYSRNSDYFRSELRSKVRQGLEMDDEDDRIDDLIPNGVPQPIVIPEPSRANRTESEWLSAMFKGKHPWYTRWLIRLFPYLNGRHNIDEIVARERIRRRDLKLIMTEFDANLIHFYHP